MKQTITRLLLLALALLPGLASAQKQLGDFIQGQTIRCPWATFDKSGNSATPGTAGTLYVYKDAATGTEKAIVADLSGTDTRAIDGNAGDHEANFATTDAFFATDADYVVRARGTVVDSQTINAPLCLFSIEHHFPLKGYILLHATEATGETSTTSQIELTGDVITSNDQYKYNRLWDVTDGWDRAIVGSNAAGDYLTIYPDAPAAPTNGATLYITKDLIYPVNFFDPASTGVTVTKVGATPGTATALSDQAGANFADVFNNGGSASGTNARIGAIATAVTPVDLGSGATSLSQNIQDAGGMVSHGTCSAGSSTTTCIDSALTQADNYWNNWTRIEVEGMPARCVRGFLASTDALSWPQALPATAANVKYRLFNDPSCRNTP